MRWKYLPSIVVALAVIPDVVSSRVLTLPDLANCAVVPEPAGANLCISRRLNVLWS